MDSVTHIALGACMGEAFAGRTVGKKAMLWGILAQSIPDIDFIASFWMKTTDDLLTHRGFTHSILFALLVSVPIAAAANRLHRPHDISFKRWLAFISSAVLVHIFLDAFNNYGTGWFEPFSHARISFNSIYVADPFFSFGPGIALILLWILRKKNTARKWIWRSGLTLSFLYLGYCVINKFSVTSETKKILAANNIHYKRLLTTPAPLQSWLWFVVAETDSGYYTGYRSVFDRKPLLDLHYTPQHNELCAQVSNQDDLNKLIRFSQHYYTLEQHVDTIILNDLRFGQITGWKDPTQGFVFYYYLQPSASNDLVVQRGRFAKWNSESFHAFIQRIKGN
ncbi:metal-dependent hydrolase [Ferruginibacter sp.]